jgi:hypothetical protein
MNIKDINTDQDEYTQEELEYMGEIIMKAEEIKANSMLFANVEKAMQSKVKKINNLSDLRRVAQDKAATQED